MTAAHLDSLFKTPLPFQKKVIPWLRGRVGECSMLCLEQGLGKTFCTAVSITPPATIACPAFLQYNWLDEVEELGYTATVVKCQADLFRDVDIFIMSYHFLVNLDLEVVQANHFIVDEFHYAKSLDAKRTQAVLAEIECIPTVTLLSGTPIPSRPVEIYPILDAIGAYDRGYYSFVHRFCNAYKSDYGLNVNGASNLDQLAEIIAPYMLRFTKKQVLPELPDKTYRVLAQDIDVSQIEKEYDVSQFKNVAPDVAFETLSTVMRMHAALKFPAVCDIIDHHLATTHEKLIVFGHHREEMLLPLIEKYADFNPGQIIGGMTPKKKRENEYKFQNDETCRIIFIGILAGGVGITLTAANRVLLAESSWVPGDIDQAADRAHRIGQTQPVSIDIVTVHGSIDEYQVRRALEKLEVTNQILQESEYTIMGTKNILEELESLRDEVDARVEAITEQVESLAEDDEPPARGRRGRKSKEDDSEARATWPTR